MLFFKKWISKLQEMFAPSKKSVQENTEVEVVAPAVQMVTLEPAVDLPIADELIEIKEPVKATTLKKASSSPKKRATSKKAPVALDVAVATKESGSPAKKSSPKKKPNIKIVK